jgi:hypothetical protein
MAFEWLVGFVTNILSSAIWDGAKRAFSKRDSWSIQTLGLESAPIQSPGPERKAEDLATLNRIQALLPDTSTIQYLREHSFGNAHRGAFLEPLDRFLEQTRGPGEQFLSPGLESLRQNFRTTVATFQGLINKYTRPHLQRDMYEVPSELEVRHPQVYWKAVNDLNKAAEEVTRQYDHLVYTARRELLR